MKKTLAILLLACVAATTFAVGSVSLGGAFNFVTGKSGEFDGLYENQEIEFKYKEFGFGADIAATIDVTKHFNIWTDFNWTFGPKMKYKVGDNDWSSTKDDYDDMKEDGATDVSKAANIMNVALGGAYRFTFKAPVDLNVGAGIFFNRALGTVKGDFNGVEERMTIKARNLGIAFLASGSYKFNDKLSLTLSVMPQLGIANFTTFKIEVDDQDIRNETETSARFSYSMPVTLGCRYSF